MKTSAEFANTLVKTAFQCALNKLVDEIYSDKSDKTSYADQFVDFVSFVVEAVNLHTEVSVDETLGVLQNAILFHISKICCCRGVIIL